MWLERSAGWPLHQAQGFLLVDLPNSLFSVTILCETPARQMGALSLEEADVQLLRAAIKGRVLLPGHKGDAQAVESLRVWAVSPDHAAADHRPEPAVIVQPRGKPAC